VIRSVKVGLACVLVAACGDDGAAPPPAPIELGAMGPLTGSAGRDGFRFGAASAATQIEDMNARTDWYAWTAPMPEGLGKGTFVGDASRGYTMALADNQLVKDLGLDSYRFSIEWARIEPMKDVIDEAAIAHYRDVLMGLKALGIRPLVTIHHFSNPVWVADPRAIDCAGGPTAQNLCGLGHPVGGAMVVAEMKQHAALVAQRFGDLVDEWGTVNEPVNYLFAAYGIGMFPPGRSTIFQLQTDFVPVVRDYLAATAGMYDAIKANDTVDADGDGVAAVVGASLSVADWEPARGNMPSQLPEDLAARDRIVYLFHYLFADALVNGTFDADLDGTPDEQHPEWKGRLDWLGLQYYFRAGVSADKPILPAPVALTPCTGGFDLGSCLQAPEPTLCVPRMGYEFWADGLRDVILAYSARYPQLPLVITESGLATDVGKRRAEAVVRILEAIAAARAVGADVRGYYHWSLTDNFEWAEGFGPHFGLYSVNYATYARTATEGADVLSAIAHARELTTEQRQTYGGTGPMTPETLETDAFCSKVSP
jgi:beta-glucosidase/6-phospho-beta-glucosidase/beta-galactosidase